VDGTSGNCRRERRPRGGERYSTKRGNVAADSLYMKNHCLRMKPQVWVRSAKAEVLTGKAATRPRSQSGPFAALSRAYHGTAPRMPGAADITGVMAATTAAVVPDRALLVRQGAVIGERWRRISDAGFVQPELTHDGLWPSFFDRIAERPCGARDPYPTDEAQRIPPSSNHQPPAQRCTILPLPAPSLRTAIRLPAKRRKIARHSTSLRFLTV
jgi:hypothetical protein